MQTYQDIILELKRFWADRGCVVTEPLDVEVGAGTMCPETFSARARPRPLQRRVRAAEPPSR